MARFPQLESLLHHRWGIPVVAELHRASGCKFVTLVRRLEVSRDSLQRTLRALIRSGWIQRNPGYGHPLRPEYILAPGARGAGEAVVELDQTLRQLRIQDPGLNKWSLAVVWALAGKPRSFSELKRELPGITSRALTLTLKELQEVGLLQRLVLDRYPPATMYRLTVWGERLCPPLLRLAG